MSTFSSDLVQGGFATSGDVLSHCEIDSLQRDLDNQPLNRSRAGIRHALRIPVVADVASDPRLLAMASQVLGPKPIPYRATLFDKSADSNWLVVWHQDTALPVQHRQDRPGWGSWSRKEGLLYAHAPATALSQILALRLHLDDSDVHNGPLRVLPATHRHGVLTDDAIHHLAEQMPAVTCCVSRGGVLAMRPLLVHASSKSLSDKPRRVLHIEYAAAPVVDGLSLATA